MFHINECGKQEQHYNGSSAKVINILLVRGGTRGARSVLSGIIGQ